MDVGSKIHNNSLLGCDALKKRPFLIIDLVKFSKSIFKNRSFLVVLQLPQLQFSCTAATKNCCSWVQLHPFSPYISWFFACSMPKTPSFFTLSWWNFQCNMPKKPSFFTFTWWNFRFSILKMCYYGLLNLWISTCICDTTHRVASSTSSITPYPHSSSE